MKYKSDVLEAIHDTMKALHEVGAISDESMKEFDESCLEPEPEEAK